MLQVRVVQVRVVLVLVLAWRRRGCGCGRVPLRGKDGKVTYSDVACPTEQSAARKLDEAPPVSTATSKAAPRDARDGGQIAQSRDGGKPIRRRENRQARRNRSRRAPRAAPICRRRVQYAKQDLETAAPSQKPRGARLASRARPARAVLARVDDLCRGRVGLSGRGGALLAGTRCRWRRDCATGPTLRVAEGRVTYSNSTCRTARRAVRRSSRIPALGADQKAARERAQQIHVSSTS